jgi:hypothetical protein
VRSDVAGREHLAEAKPELLFLVARSGALDLGHEDGLVALPGQVEVRFRGLAGTRLDPGGAERASEPVLGVGVAFQTTFDCCRVDAERLVASRQLHDPGLTVGRADCGVRGPRAGDFTRAQHRLARAGEHDVEFAADCLGERGAEPGRISGRPDAAKPEARSQVRLALKELVEETEQLAVAVVADKPPAASAVATAHSRHPPGSN